jgi:hypothetical protein
VIHLAQPLLPCEHGTKNSGSLFTSDRSTTPVPAYWDRFIHHDGGLHAQWGNLRGALPRYCVPCQRTQTFLVGYRHFFCRWPFLHWPLPLQEFKLRLPELPESSHEFLLRPKVPRSGLECSLPALNCAKTDTKKAKLLPLAARIAFK